MSSPGYFYDSDEQAQNEAIRRRQAYAQALMGGDQLQGQNAGLANAGNKLLGAFLTKKLDKQQQDLAGASQTRYSNDLARLLGGSVPPHMDANNPGSPQGGSQLDPEGNPASSMQSPAQPQPQGPGSFAQRLAGTNNPFLMQQFAPELIKQQLNRDEKTWENDQPLSRSAREQGALTLGNQQALSTFNNGLPMTAAQAATNDLGRAHLRETISHDRQTEAAAAQSAEFGKGMQGRAYSTLAHGLKDPAFRSTPEYQTAWQILSNPKIDPNTGTIVVPDLSAFAPPVGQNGQPGVQQRMPSLQAFAPPNPSQAEAGSAGYANRLQESSAQIDQTQGALGSLTQHTMGAIPGVGNFMVSPEYQKGDQAQRNFINAQLRRESGAAISESEFANARKQYIPQPGDSKEVLAQKKASRDMAIRNMQLSAGNTLLPPGVVQQASPPRGAPMVPQQQGFGQGSPAPIAPVTATGPNGQKLILQNGQWVPVNGR